MTLKEGLQATEISVPTQWYLTAAFCHWFINLPQADYETRARDARRTRGALTDKTGFLGPSEHAL